MSIDKLVMGKRLRRQREKASLTREEFAELVEITPQFLAELENGTKGMSADTLFKICERGGVSADYLLLGRQSMDGYRSRAAEILCEIPPQYSENIENVLEVFLKTIKAAEQKEV